MKNKLFAVFIFLFLAFFYLILNRPIEIGKAYNFTTIDGAFTYTYNLGKGSWPESFNYKFERYLEINNLNADTIEIYRTFKKDWKKIYHWYDYLTSDLYDYPYLKIE